MRILTLVLLLSALGCAKDSSSPSLPAHPRDIVHMDSVPDHCTHTTSGAHTFREWGDFTADSYSCSTFPGQACTLSIAIDKSHAEMVCTDAGASFPSQCTHYAQGAHMLIDGTVIGANAADCGLTFGALRCFYFTSISGSTNEMICLDNDLAF